VVVVEPGDAVRAANAVGSEQLAVCQIYLRLVSNFGVSLLLREVAFAQHALTEVARLTLKLFLDATPAPHDGVDAAGECMQSFAGDSFDHLLEFWVLLFTSSEVRGETKLASGVDVSGYGVLFIVFIFVSN
jgi:hypothetical protein